MSLLLSDRIYTMESSTAKRGIYPLHGYKLGLYRLPIKLHERYEIDSIVNGLKQIFNMDVYADRIYAIHSWIEENTNTNYDPEKIELSVTVEIVTGDVVDIIYQIFPIEKYGDFPWVIDYRKKADNYAKMIIDTILRNTILADKLIESFVRSDKSTVEDATKKLETITPLAQIVPNAKPKPQETQIGEQTNSSNTNDQIQIPVGVKPGPIDIEYKTNMKTSEIYTVTDNGNKIKTWGRVGKDNKIMGVWGEFVSVDFDICIADGACIDACPVDVYEWFDSPGNIASEKKPLMIREPDCIFCLACEGVCPPQAIKIFEKK